MSETKNVNFIFMYYAYSITKFKASLPAELTKVN